MRWPALLAVAALLAGCEREPVRTVVHGPAPVQAVPSQPLPVPGKATIVPTPEAPAPDVQLAQAPPAPMGDAATPGDRDGAALLALRELRIPVAGVQPDQLSNTYDQARGARRHEAIDIMAARGTPVHAVDDGTLVKLFNSKPGGLTVYQFDAERKLSYYYAHLDRYAEGVHEGMQLRRGDLLGYVGVTGNAAPDSPHLHFAVFRLGPDQQWWKGEPVNPYPALRNAREGG
jgi:murein DD-endopeptidase MepM/ murein hydrolase activator NlpD